MGSVHNVPNYVMVGWLAAFLFSACLPFGGFFILGLSTFSIMLAIMACLPLVLCWQLSSVPFSLPR